MNRSTGLPALLAAAAVAVSTVAVTAPATAEAVVYDTHHVKADAEHASIDIPTGYTKHRENWHRFIWAEQFEGGRAIVLDLRPEADTVKELKAERGQLVGAESYEEFAFVVNEPGSRVRARWVFTYSEPGTGDVDPFVSVMLMSGNRLQVAGKLAEKEQIKQIRRHVIRHLTFPG
jgi:hypothetical protein